MNIIHAAVRVATAVAAYSARARRFFYEVMLFDHACPKCHGSLAMVREGCCRCAACAHSFDPTVAFQRCSACGGTPKIEVRRYRCSQCGEDISSRFLFDGLVFDAEYFRQKMAEHRHRKRDQHARLRAAQMDDRSPVLDAGPADLGAVQGLIEALDSLTAGGTGDFPWPIREGFDLSRYERHIQAHIQPIPILFDQIPPIGDNARRDRIWRFIALVFLAHAGLVDLRQKGQTITVMQREAN